jgi:hypothetical protein
MGNAAEGSYLVVCHMYPRSGLIGTLHLIEAKVSDITPIRENFSPKRPQVEQIVPRN